MVTLANAEQSQVKRATRAAYGVTLAELAGEGVPVVAVDADLTGSTTTAKFAKAGYADRLFNCGIAEQNMIDVAAGLATTGNIAFTGSFAVFGTGRAYDQIRNTVCYSDLNVKIAPTHAGVSVGPDGGSHQMLEDISLMAGLPHMRVLVPADYAAAVAAIRLAAETPGPVYVRMGRASVPAVYADGVELELGRAYTLREGSDVTIVACGVEVEQALAAAHDVGYPVLVRPSYVLGGQGMEIAYNDRNITEFMRIINQVEQEHPILVDKYLMGREVEVDGVFDGEELLIPGIMEHIERAGVHSGDSISVYPPIHIEDKHKQTILKYTYDLSRALGVVGLVNIQFVIYDDQVYVIEVNPRSSRTIPYISKVTGVPIIDLATRVMLGQKLRDLGYGTGIYREADYYAVKMPVFSFEKLTDVDTGLGPEMKSTGECLGLAESFPQALLKAFKGAGMKAPKKGGRIIVTVKDEDKDEMIGIARGFYDMGIELLATSGTCKALNEAGIPARWVARVSEAHPNILDMIASGTVDLVINTPTRGRRHDTDGFKIRRSTVEHSVACITAIDTARAMLTVRTQGRAAELRPIDITEI